MFKVHKYISAKKMEQLQCSHYGPHLGKKSEFGIFLTKIFPSILNLRIRRSSLNIAPMTFYQKIDPT